MRILGIIFYAGILMVLGILLLFLAIASSVRASFIDPQAIAAASLERLNLASYE